MISAPVCFGDFFRTSAADCNGAFKSLQNHLRRKLGGKKLKSCDHISMVLLVTVILDHQKKAVMPPEPEAGLRHEEHWQESV